MMEDTKIPAMIRAGKGFEIISDDETERWKVDCFGTDIAITRYDIYQGKAECIGDCIIPKNRAKELAEAISLVAKEC